MKLWQESMQKVIVVKFSSQGLFGLDRLYQSHKFPTFPVQVAEIIFLQALGMEGAAEEVQWVVEISGSTRSTLLHGKIHPKDWQVLSLGDARFLPIF